jgi:hypothetical protein
MKPTSLGLTHVLDRIRDDRSELTDRSLLASSNLKFTNEEQRKWRAVWILERLAKEEARGRLNR